MSNKQTDEQGKPLTYWGGLKNRTCDHTNCREVCPECQLPQQENYRSKESDDKFDIEKEMFELEQQLDIPSHMRWHNKTSSQTEISDKEIFYQKQVMNPYPSTKHLYTAWEKGFMECAKWYREQLKNKL